MACNALAIALIYVIGGLQTIIARVDAGMYYETVSLYYRSSLLKINVKVSKYWVSVLYFMRYNYIVL